MPKRFHNRQLLARQEADQRSAARADIAKLIRDFILLRSRHGITAAHNRVGLRIAQCLEDLLCSGFAQTFLENAHGAIDEHGFRIRYGIAVQADRFCADVDGREIIRHILRRILDALSFLNAAQIHRKDNSVPVLLIERGCLRNIILVILCVDKVNALLSDLLSDGMEQNIAPGDVITMSAGCRHTVIAETKLQMIEVQLGRNISAAGYTAKTLATMLVDECNREYAYNPTDDATACIVKVRRREPVNILFGPPRNRDDSNRMMTLYFSKEGKHIICGGTTASIAAKYLRKEVRVSMALDDDSDVPPISEIDGVDLVTEGVITMNRVVEYAKDSLEENELYEKWGFGHDGASLICRMLFEEATDVNFYVGRAVNPAHQNPDLPISFNIKMQLVKELEEYLKKMGKRVKVSYF